MKNALLLFTLVLTQISIGQSLNDMKYDSIVKVQNTDLSLIYAKKKTAVWHDAGFFVTRPSKNHFVFLEAARLLVEVDFKAKSFYAIVQDENTGGYKRFFLANDGFEADIYLDYTTYSEGILVDTTFYKSSFTEINNFERREKIGRIALQFSKKYLSICDYKKEYTIDDFTPLKSVMDPDEDSISFHGETVYSLPSDTITSIANSGVLYLKTKEFAIPRKYAELYHVNNRVVTSMDTTNNLYFYNSKINYKLQQLDKNTVHLLKDSIQTTNPKFIILQPNFLSIEDVENRNISIVYNQKSTAVIDGETNTYLREPSQNLFFQIKSFESILELDPQMDSIYLIIYSYELDTYKRIYVGQKEFTLNILHLPETGENNICFNGNYYDTDFNKLDYDCNSTGHDGNIVIKLKKEGNLVYLTDYSQSFEIEDYYFDDSGNEITYTEKTPGSQNSGVYDLQSKKWITPQTYSKVENNGRYILTSTELDKNNISLDSGAFYQLFEMKNGETTLVKDNITTNNIKVVALMTNYDSIKQTSDNSYYSTYENGKQGLMEYQLFNEYEYSYLDFRNKVIEKPEFNFIYYSNSGVYICKNELFYQVRSLSDGILMDSLMNGGSLSETEDAPILKINKKDGSVSEIDNHSTILYEVGLHQINDSLILIKDVISEYQEDYPLIDEYGYDSAYINDFGEWVYVYPPAEPGQYHCGVYNLNQNRWVIQPNEFDIQFLGGNHLIVEKPIFDENHLIIDKNNYHIIDLTGKILYSDLTQLDIFKSNEIIESILVKDTELLLKSNNGKKTHHKLPDNTITEKYFYIVNEGKYKLVKLDQNLDYTLFTDFHDFVYSVESIPLSFYLDDTIAQLSISDSSRTTLEIGSQNFTLEILFIENIDTYEDGMFQVNLNGQIFYESNLKVDLVNRQNYLTKITITKTDNEIIINCDKPLKSLYSQHIAETENESIYWSFETEESEIWRINEHNNWECFSPNFSKIEKTDMNYICKTGMLKYDKYNRYFDEYEGFFIDDNLIESKNYPPSYVILDSALKPIGYSDFYNFDLIKDLGFGLKITPVIDKDKWNTPEGHGNSFLVDYTGKAICDAKYDNFELIDGKIYGVRDEIYQIDQESGEIEYDMYSGEPILVQKAERVLIGEYTK